MRRLAAAVLVTLTALLGGAAPASAKPDATLNREVSGPFTGTSRFDFFTGGCSFIHQAFDGAYQTEKGKSGSFHVDVCPTFSPGDSRAVGTFTVRTPDGSALTGTVTGVYDASTPPRIPFEFTLTAVTGTKGLKHASGTILMDGVWQFDSNPGPVSGTLAGSLER